MPDSHMFDGLRQRLGARLRQVIGNPVIQRKELAASTSSSPACR